MKRRLDLLLVEKGFADSRQRARELIMTGRVLVNDFPAAKPGAQVSEVDHIKLQGDPIPYVSRGGLKLEAALKGFSVDPGGMTCMDVGASTGGFTDCLLQHGALLVYAVDVGYGQLAWKLRRDPRVIAIERANIRYLAQSALAEPVDLVVIDVSFISLKIVVPNLFKFLKPDAVLIALIKPQFEVGKGMVGKGGVVRDPQLHDSVLDDLMDFFIDQNLEIKATMPSPILGPKGNKEFLIHLRFRG
ncbi:MAG: TlyA family RNA methyltransferase [Desulfobacteraceae bacterium]|nr:MAG: TlyA family RNA methyltransferase [Desulfobacteraceae bacterium]